MPFISVGRNTYSRMATRRRPHTSIPCTRRAGSMKQSEYESEFLSLKRVLNRIKTDIERGDFDMLAKHITFSSIRCKDLVVAMVCSEELLNHSSHRKDVFDKVFIEMQKTQRLWGVEGDITRMRVYRMFRFLIRIVKTIQGYLEKNSDLYERNIAKSETIYERSGFYKLEVQNWKSTLENIEKLRDKFNELFPQPRLVRVNEFGLGRGKTKSKRTRARSRRRQTKRASNQT